MFHIALNKMSWTTTHYKKNSPLLEICARDYTPRKINDVVNGYTKNKVTNPSHSCRREYENFEK